MGWRCARLVLLVGMLWPRAAAATAPDDDDDPAFARRRAQQKPAVAPAPAPAAAEDDDSDPTPRLPPALQASVSAPVAVATVAATSKSSTVDADADAGTWRGPAPRRGLRIRLAYRRLTVPEIKDAQQHLGDDAFHGLALEIYPLSGFARVGLSTQVAIESGGDFIVSEGVTLGFTLPHARFAPFIEGGVHAGVGQRSVWVPTMTAPSDFPTVMLLWTGELGVDARLGRQTAVSVAVGLQRSTFYLSFGDPADPLVLVHDTTTTFKVGIGY